MAFTKPEERNRWLGRYLAIYIQLLQKALGPGLVFTTGATRWAAQLTNLVRHNS